MDNHLSLADEIATFAHDALDGFVERFCAEDRLPQIIAGVPTSPGTLVTLVHLYGLAQSTGADKVAGRSSEARIRALLPSIEATRLEPHHAFQLAETILQSGHSLEDHPLLQEMDEQMVTTLRQALIATDIFDSETETLPGRPSSDWAVLARAEYNRSRLGLLDDPLIMRTALEQVQKCFKDSPMNYVDDSPEGTYRFDIKVFEQLLLCEPFLDLLDPGPYRAALNAADRLFNLAMLENGASVAWGRSTGAFSLTTRIRLAALLLKSDSCRTPSRTLALAQDAFECFVSEWWSDDAIVSYRDRIVDGQAPAPQLLETSARALTELLEAVNLLRAVDTSHAYEAADELYPEQDGFLRFAPGRGSCWFFRNPHLCFQWPLVGGPTSDYMATATHPSALPQPADTPMGCGVPQAFYDDQRFYPQACPYSVDKQPNGITFMQKGLATQEQPGQVGSSRAFKRQVKADVYGNTLQVRETWIFPAELPDLLAFHIAEGDIPLEISWQCSSEHASSVVDVKGMSQWRSYWGPIARVHQLNITPAAEIHIAYSITPLA